jgi:hypothetical protein
VNRVTGVDLGQVTDPSAICILDQVEQRYHVRRLERPKLGTSYPDVVKRVAQIMGHSEMADSELVVDATGVGRPVVDAMVVAGLSPIPVLITGGNAVTVTDGWWHVPKRELVSCAQMVLQQGRLRLPESSPLTQPLVTELRAFRVKLSAAGHDSYNAREGEHDDLVLALCLALWRARMLEEEPEPPAAPRPGTDAWREAERRRIRARVMEGVEEQVRREDEGGASWDM